MENEIWKDIEGYDGFYQISNLGRIQSYYNHRQTKRKNPKIISPYKIYKGYFCIKLWSQMNRSKKTFLISRLVAQCFIPNYLNKPCVNHKDGNKLNNYYTNLEWVTNAENMQHSYLSGLHNSKGENSGRAILNCQQVIEIRKLYKIGKYNQNKISKLYNVSQSHISNIINRVYWDYILD